MPRLNGSLACDHAEAKLDGGRRAPDRHDCEYVDWRDSLITIAEMTADAKHPQPIGATVEELASWSRRWDAAFHREMNRLAHDPFLSTGGGVLQ